MVTDWYLVTGKNRRRDVAVNTDSILLFIISVTGLQNGDNSGPTTRFSASYVAEFQIQRACYDVKNSFGPQPLCTKIAWMQFLVNLRPALSEDYLHDAISTNVGPEVCNSRYPTRKWRRRARTTCPFSSGPGPFFTGNIWPAQNPDVQTHLSPYEGLSYYPYRISNVRLRLPVEEHEMNMRSWSGVKYIDYRERWREDTDNEALSRLETRVQAMGNCVACLTVIMSRRLHTGAPELWNSVIRAV
ncbi:hypothetical protein CBL_02601 [Carabus blaptoides fortunei]